jgi:hypothetical protein
LDGLVRDSTGRWQGYADIVRELLVIPRLSAVIASRQIAQESIAEVTLTVTRNNEPVYRCGSPRRRWTTVIGSPDEQPATVMQTIEIAPSDHAAPRTYICGLPTPAMHLV